MKGVNIMKFTQKIFLYKVNEDNTITFYVPNDDPTQKAKYFKANARLALLVDLSKLDQGAELLVNIGVYYDRVLKLQIIDVIVDA